MARKIGSLVAEKNRRIGRGTYVWLLYLETVNPSSGELEAYRFCSHGERLEYGTASDGSAVLWYPAPFAVGELEEEGDGSIPSVPVTIANVREDLVEKLLERDFLAGQRAIVTLVHTSTLADPAAQISWEGAVGGVEVTERAIAFQISSAPLFELEAPQVTVVEDSCGNVYGADGCEFPIDLLDPGKAVLGDCQKRLVDCRARKARAVALGHTPILWPLNFSAEPGVEDS